MPTTVAAPLDVRTPTATVPDAVMAPPTVKPADVSAPPLDREPARTLPLTIAAPGIVTVLEALPSVTAPARTPTKTTPPTEPVPASKMRSPPA